MALTPYQVQVRLAKIPMQEREPVRTQLKLNAKSGAPDPKDVAKIAKAHEAVSEAFAAIDPVSGDGVPAYVAAKTKLREIIESVEAWMLEHGERVGVECAARADDLEDELQALCARADDLRDRIAEERARAALLRNRNLAARGGPLNVSRHRPGGDQSTAAKLGVEPREDIALVSQVEAKKLRRGQDAVALDGSTVAAGSRYRAVTRNAAQAHVLMEA